MLQLSRRQDESIIIGGNIEVKVLEIVSSKCVKIGISAPRSIPIMRREVLEEVSTGKRDQHTGKRIPQKKGSKLTGECATIPHNEYP